MSRTFRVEEANLKLCYFLKQKLESAFSLKLIKKTIEAGSCRVNKQVISYSNHLLKKGDIVEISLDTPKEMAVSVVLDDPLFCIIHKPSGLLSDEKALKPFFKTPIFCVHRLDKETSGLLILAKNLETKKYFDKAFKEKKIIKKYIALCDGLFLETQGTIDLPITLSAMGHHKIVAIASKTGEHPALTLWEKLAVGDKATLVDLEIKTGKTHQIRAHLSAVGHPVLGDKIYLKKPVCSYLPKKLCLHAYLLAFDHPETNKQVIMKLKPPKEFMEALRGVYIDAKCLNY